MKFKKEVEELFKKAGWYKGRNVKQKFDTIPRFQEFLYEYGNLGLETHKEDSNEPTAIFRFKSTIKRIFQD